MPPRVHAHARTALRGRCNYVSVSLKESDCSWYSKCDVRQLKFLSFTGHRTVAVRR